MSRAQLSARIGVGPQQLQKYEIGLNRVPASRLWSIGEALDCPLQAFFPASGVPIPQDHTHSEITPQEARTLVSLYERLSEEERTSILGLLQAMASQTEPD
ncbi:DNA-binding protein, putative [Salipiger mucosus DSM 16094]|uniref:DNA-binding protein, putative n=2 Tax=Salipiger mucosus TaxID=263378 RepID=S9RUZ9_9RHOB|nr:DNA-binding protein, putative [Salipiger mucosus DSM 16094]